MSARVTNILLVEDDALDVMSVCRAFRKAEVTSQLRVVSNGLEALEALRSEDLPPLRRLVLLDLNMPKMSGIEFLRALRTDPALRSTPVVVLTTSNDARDRMEAFKLNVAGYLIKPIHFASLVDLMAALSAYWSRAEMP